MSLDLGRAAPSSGGTTFGFGAQDSSTHSLECERHLCIVLFLQTKSYKRIDSVSILECVLTMDEHGVVLLQDGPSPQGVNLTTRSKEEARLADERTSLRVTAVAVCGGISEVLNSLFCDGQSICSVLYHVVCFGSHIEVF